jgi:hypothetical protein
MLTPSPKISFVVDDEVTAVNADAEFDPAVPRHSARAILRWTLTRFPGADRGHFAGKRTTAVAAHN